MSQFASRLCLPLAGIALGLGLTLSLGLGIAGSTTWVTVFFATLAGIAADIIPANRRAAWLVWWLCAWPTAGIAIGNQAGDWTPGWTVLLAVVMFLVALTLAAVYSAVVVSSMSDRAGQAQAYPPVG